MTLTRKSLKAMGIEDEKIDQIIEDHSETVEALKKQRDAYKADAEKVSDLEKKIQELEDADDFKEKYEAEHQAFEEYKSQVEADKLSDTVRGLYKDLLKDVGIDEKRIEAVLRVTDLSKLGVNKDGSLKDSENLKKGIEEDWADFIVTTSKKGANVETPPTGNTAKKTKDEIMAIKDTAERQAAIAESLANNDGVF